MKKWAILAAAFLSFWFLLLFLLYPLQIARLVLRSGSVERKEFQQAMLLVLGRIPEGLGVAGIWFGKLLRRQGRLMEYK